jgi:hypothetical protein
MSDSTNASDDPISTVLATVPNRPPASLYDVASLYTACDRYERLTESTLPESMRLKDVSNLSVADDLLSSEETKSIIAARVDLSGEKPTLANKPVEVQNYTQSNQFQLGFLKNQRKAGAATDYSITNHSGTSASEIETLAHDTWGSRFLRGRFEEWPQRDGAQKVAERHDNGSIIEQLATLGQDEKSMEKLETALINTVDFEETRALVTVKIKLETDGEYLWPGEIPVLNEAAYECRREHFREGISMPDSDPTGEGTGYIHEEDGSVTGGSPGILGQFGKKQPELFSNMDKNNAWRGRPLSADAAVDIDRFGAVIDNFYTGFQGIRFYLLPYPESNITPEVFQQFYSDVYRPLVDSPDSEFRDQIVQLFEDQVDVEQLVEKTQVESDTINDFLKESDTAESMEGVSSFNGRDTWLRVYGLFTAKGLDPTQVFVDEPAISLGPLTDLEAAYRNLGLSLRGSTIFGELVERTDYVRPSQNVAKQVLSGRWFYSTISLSVDPADESDDDPAPDDPFLTLTGKLVRGEKVNTDRLLDLFTQKIEREFRDNQANGDGNFPTNVVLGQYARITALANTGLLVKNNISYKCEHNYAFMESNTIEKEDKTREQQLQAFINEHNALASAEARAVFLLGGLVGRLTAFQHSEGVSRKLVEQHPASSITKRSIAAVTSKVLEKNETYAQMEEDRGNMNQRYVSRLADVMLEKDPSEWSLTTQEIRWLYSLGIAYGKSDTFLEEDEKTASTTAN